ncbi:hypothetical protein E8E14_001515 [Neopestalotiopsis sp. 37M]|nr:hypothetical protein E8E14_001515 [Neopestalotiopsis sp. 37M]
MYGGKALVTAIIIGIAAIIYNATVQSRTSFQPVPGKNNTVLFITAEHAGLCNVHLATAYSLLVNHPETKIHYASFPKIEKRTQHISDVAVQKGASGERIVFHPLEGEGYVDTQRRHLGGQEVIRNGPGVEGHKVLSRNMPEFISPWSAEDYWEIYEQVADLIDAVDPSVVVLDTVFLPGTDATRNKQRLHALVTPNMLSDMLPAEQPAWTLFWKYPAIGSGFPYPVPWSLIPSNIYMNFKMIQTVMNLPALRAKQEWLRAKGVVNPIDFMGYYKPHMPWITQTLPGAHLPLAKIPTNVTLAGPINLAGLEHVTVDGNELLDWVEQRRTVLIALGSGFKYDEPTARTMLQALENVLATMPDVQILWKMHKLNAFDDTFLKQAVEKSSGRLRMEKWLEVELPTLLQSKSVVAFVHHGGAGCFHDAIGAGTPQVILPQWADLYDYAVIAETIGVGVWGCRETSPDWTNECLEHALLSVLQDGPTSFSLASKAQAFGELASSMGPGRDAAARIIAGLAGSGDH